jgi:hypothetical protein
MRRSGRAEVEAAIGEQLIVPDPLLTAVQAVALLAVPVARIVGMAAVGRVATARNPTGSPRFLLSDQERGRRHTPCRR